VERTARIRRLERTGVLPTWDEWAAFEAEELGEGARIADRRH